VTPAQLALRWVLEQGDNCHVIPGTTRIDHLEENHRASELAIPPEAIAEAGRIINHDTVCGHRYHDAIRPTIDTEEESASTFSVDVDTASYSITRSYLREGTLVPEAAVRVEEFVNSFDYDYAPPRREAFSLHAEAFPSPNREGFHLLHLGVRGRQGVPAIGCLGIRVVDLEDAADRLVLEPFARVPLAGLGGHGEFGRGQRSAIAGGPVPAEPVAEVDGERLERAERRGEDPVGEGVDGIGGIRPVGGIAGAGSCGFGGFGAGHDASLRSGALSR